MPERDISPCIRDVLDHCARELIGPVHANFINIMNRVAISRQNSPVLSIG